MAWTPKEEDLALLAALLEAGLPLAEATGTIASMSQDPATRAAAMHLERRLDAGSSFTAALDDLLVPRHVRMLLDGGERTGRLTQALRSAAHLTRRLATLRSEFRRALIYPSLVLSIGIAILAVISLVVIPPLERTFLDLGAELPRVTRFVLAASRPFTSARLWVLVAVVVTTAALRRKRWSTDRRTPPRRVLRSLEPAVTFVRPVMDRTVRSLPLVGRLHHDLRMAVIAHVLASLGRGGVALDVALRSVAASLRSGPEQLILDEASDAAREGRNPFDEAQLGRMFDRAELGMLRVGEANGVLAEQWERIAHRRDRALEGRIARIGAIIEPVLVAAVGVIVGGAVLALYLPTFRVMELL
jgi:type II secretory pathway component PulF